MGLKNNENFFLQKVSKKPNALQNRPRSFERGSGGMERPRMRPRKRPGCMVQRLLIFIAVIGVAGVWQYGNLMVLNEEEKVMAVMRERETDGALGMEEESSSFSTSSSSSLATFSRNEEAILEHNNQATTETIVQPKYSVYDCKSRLKKNPGSLPDFLIIGVHKGGSTALYGYLALHGLVKPSVCKETHFFTKDNLYRKGKTYYRRHFVDLTEFNNQNENHDSSPSSNSFITGEGTPNYIRNPIALKRISRTLPNVKIIVSFRDPVVRFVSQYIGFHDRGLTKKSCDAFWKQQLDEIQKCTRTIVADQITTTKETSTRGLSPYQALHYAMEEPVADKKRLNDMRNTQRRYKACSSGDDNCFQRQCYAKLHENAIVRSIYVDQLVRWLQYYPPSQIHLVQAEKLFTDTEQTMQSVTRFLNLRRFTDNELKAFQKTNKGSSHISQPRAQTCNKEIMQEFFFKETELLKKVIENQWKDTWWETWDYNN